MIACTITEWTAASLSTYWSLKHIIRTKDVLLFSGRDKQKQPTWNVFTSINSHNSLFMTLCLQPKHARDARCAVIAMNLCSWLSRDHREDILSFHSGWLSGSDQLLMQSDREQQPKEDLWSERSETNLVTHKSTNPRAATASCWKAYTSQDGSYFRGGNVPDPRSRKVMI